MTAATRRSGRFVVASLKLMAGISSECDGSRVEKAAVTGGSGGRVVSSVKGVLSRFQSSENDTLPLKRSEKNEIIW